MRLFLMNTEEVFDKADMGKRSKISGETLKKEVKLLEEIGLIRSRVVVKMRPKKSGKDGILEKDRKSVV